MVVGSTGHCRGLDDVVVEAPKIFYGLHSGDLFEVGQPVGVVGFLLWIVIPHGP